MRHSKNKNKKTEKNPNAIPSTANNQHKNGYLLNNDQGRLVNQASDIVNVNE